MSLNEAFNLNYKLIISKLLRYSSRAAAKSAAGICSPYSLLSMPIFFGITALAHLYYIQYCYYCYIHQSMVAQAGQPLGWPVSSKAGTANSVWATTNEICSSGGSYKYYLPEAILWLQPLIISTCYLNSGYLVYNVHYSPVLRLFLWQGCFMHDYRPENSEEVLDHCRALINSIIEQNNLAFKEILTFVLWERIELLSKMLVGETTEEESHALLHF
ncbi:MULTISPECIES: ash family protein [Photorhabdus]|uniref:ash family protein n=1 Tax=Photorhabdus TaxID=29487 RepID=UPI00232DCF10|nr:ash family protein [Photorhabdus bodei]MDB6366828.1 ash family protein [Photorhabdus bodei]